MFSIVLQVCEVYRLHRETLYLAIDFIDRYLCITRNVKKQQLQLIGITSLFVAAKLEVNYKILIEVSLQFNSNLS